jgi:hypothetical protein
MTPRRWYAEEGDDDMTTSLEPTAMIQRNTYAFALADHELRDRARSAPAWMKRRLDAARQARGQRPLWSDDTTRRRAADKAKRLRAYIALTKITMGSRGS